MIASCYFLLALTVVSAYASVAQTVHGEQIAPLHDMTRTDESVTADAESQVQNSDELVSAKTTAPRATRRHTDMFGSLKSKTVGEKQSDHLGLASAGSIKFPITGKNCNDVDFLAFNYFQRFVRFLIVLTNESGREGVHSDTVLAVDANQLLAFNRFVSLNASDSSVRELRASLDETLSTLERAFTNIRRDSGPSAIDSVISALVSLTASPASGYLRPALIIVSVVAIVMIMERIRFSYRRLTALAMKIIVISFLYSLFTNFCKLYDEARAQQLLALEKHAAKCANSVSQSSGGFFSAFKWLNPWSSSDRECGNYYKQVNVDPIFQVNLWMALADTLGQTFYFCVPMGAAIFEMTDKFILSLGYWDLIKLLVVFVVVVLTLTLSFTIYTTVPSTRMLRPCLGQVSRNETSAIQDRNQRIPAIEAPQPESSDDGEEPPEISLSGPSTASQQRVDSERVVDATRRNSKLTTSASSDILVENRPLRSKKVIAKPNSTASSEPDLQSGDAGLQTENGVPASDQESKVSTRGSVSKLKRSSVKANVHSPR